MNRRSFLFSTAAAFGSFMLWSPMARALGRGSSAEKILRECAQICADQTRQLSEVSGIAFVAAEQCQKLGRVSPALSQSLADAARRALNSRTSAKQDVAIRRCLSVCESQLCYV